jgi:plastocyanin
MKKLYSSFLILSLLSCFSAKAEIITIDQSGTTFSPNAINVNVGDVIHFVWSGGNHNTTSLTVPAGAATWASPLTMANPTFDYTVEVAGAYGYVCTIHAPNMAGGFVAQAASSVIEANLTSNFTAGVDYNNHVLFINMNNYQPSAATLTLIDITGKEVSQLLRRELGIGEQSFRFDVSDRTAGIYFIKLEQNNHIITRRVLLN